MSTEVEAPDRRRFRRTWLAVVAVLAVAAGGLGAASVAQGPKLSSATVNPAAAVERAGARLVLEADQPLHDVTAADVAVEPAAPLELTLEGARLTVRFTGLLRYASAYRVEIPVTSAATGARGTLRYAFTTPDVSTYSLERDPGGTDRVMRHSLAGGTPDAVVAEAPRIQQYAPLDGTAFALITRDEEGLPGLAIAADGTVAPVATGPARDIRELHVASSGDLLGYVLDADGSTGTGTLSLLDLTDSSWTPIEVRGPGGTSLAVLDWRFVPGTTSVVVQAADLQLYLVDPVAGTEPTPLGQHTELRGFLPGTLQLVVADPESGGIVDLADGTTTALALPAADAPAALYPAAFVLTSRDSYLQLYVDPMGYTDVGARAILYAVDASGTRELYRPATPTSRIGAVCLSPNGQYLAIEEIPGDAASDEYPGAPGWSGTTIYYLDATTGATTRGVTGMAPDWCG